MTASAHHHHHHNHHAAQQHYYDEATNPEFEIRRPRGCGKIYEYLIEHKFRTGMSVLGLDVTGLTVLEVCCGSGLMTEALARRGARVTGTDVSFQALVRARERARRYGFHADFRIAAAEALPFRDRSFDVVAVHDGLHHLEDPFQAIQEMARVANRAVLILEPARAALTGLAVHLGLAEEIEEAGNRVHRLAARDVSDRLREAGFTQVAWRRTLMYYPHEPFAWFRWFDPPPCFGIFRTAFWMTNLALGHWGNKLALGASRNGAAH
jgi:2-polyprenyl-3-methyl-5-hydroxy-6-metoxy-1,4-benzoquinol methylase